LEVNWNDINFMAIRLFTPDAQTRVEWYKKVASTAFAFNDLVYIDSNGFVAKAADGALFVPLGLIQKTVAATDSDYASNTKVPVLVPGPDAEFLCDVSTGTAAQTDVGEWIDIDDENSVDVSASTYDVFYVTRFVSTTQVVAKMAKKSGAAA
jgi:hypothetical protein